MAADPGAPSLYRKVAEDIKAAIAAGSYAAGARIQRRWAGVYSEVVSDDVNSEAGEGALYHRSAIAPGVVLVTGPGGRGMTCAPAIAEETFGWPG